MHMQNTNDDDNRQNTHADHEQEICFYMHTHCHTITVLLRRIECMRPMFPASVKICNYVCLSGGCMRIRCVKVAERIAVPLGINTPKKLINIVLDGGPNRPQRGGGGVGEISPIVQCMSG